MTWTCVVCGKASCRGGEFCAAWTERKVSAGSGAYLREPKREAQAKVYATGGTRRLDGVQEREMTDGSQRWWVTG